MFYSTVRKGVGIFPPVKTRAMEDDTVVGKGVCRRGQQKPSLEHRSTLSVGTPRMVVSECVSPVSQEEKRHWSRVIQVPAQRAVTNSCNRPTIDREPRFETPDRHRGKGGRVPGTPPAPGCLDDDNGQQE